MHIGELTHILLITVNSHLHITAIASCFDSINILCHAVVYLSESYPSCKVYYFVSYF